MSRTPSPAPAPPAEAIHDAGPPFHDIMPGLTVVLRSSNDLDFFVFKSILAKVSVVFRDMFDLPNASPEVSSSLEYGTSSFASAIRLRTPTYPISKTLVFSWRLVAST